MTHWGQTQPAGFVYLFSFSFASYSHLFWGLCLDPQPLQLRALFYLFESDNERRRIHFTQTCFARGGDRRVFKMIRWVIIKCSLGKPWGETLPLKSISSWWKPFPHIPAVMKLLRRRGSVCVLLRHLFLTCMCLCVRESESQRVRAAEAAVGDVSPLQTSDQMPGRELQLGSWGKSAQLFIGLMGCHLQSDSQHRSVT